MKGGGFRPVTRLLRECEQTSYKGAPLSRAPVEK